MNRRELSEIDTANDQAFLLVYKNLEEAESLAEACLDRSEAEEYRKGVLDARISLGAIAVYRGDLDLARDKLNRIEQELITHASPDDCLMRLARVRGIYFMKEGNYRDAFDNLVQAGVLAARLGNTVFQGLSANGKGCLKLDQQEYKDAHRYFLEAKEYGENAGNELFNVVVSLNLGCVLRGMEKLNEAEEVLNETLSLARNQQSGVLESSVLDELGVLMLDMNRTDAARDYLEEGIQLSGALGNDEIIRDLVCHYAGLLAGEGQVDQAEKVLSEYSAEHKDDVHRPLFYQILAEVHEQRQDYKKALESYKTLHQVQNKITGEGVVLSVLKQEKSSLQETNHQLRLVSTIGQELVANLDIGRILNLIYAQMNVLMPIDLLAVALVSGNNINVKFALKNGKRIKPVNIHKENPDSLIAWSVRNQKEIFMRDSQLEFREFVGRLIFFDEEESDSGKSLRSVICIPLLYINEVVGVLTVQSFKRNAYTNRDLENLRALASYAGIAIRNALQTEKMTELNELLRRQSAIDSLTGLVNRRELLRRTRNIWRVCRRNRFWVTLIMIDLDHFKCVNDLHGHAAGDDVLKKIGAVLNDFFQRPLDCACRYGGEELLVIAGNMRPPEAAARVELLREEIASLEFRGKDDTPFHVAFSSGIYGEVPEADMSSRMNKITALTDSFLYQAKAAGRNCSFLADEADKPAEKFVFRSLKT